MTIFAWGCCLVAGGAAGSIQQSLSLGCVILRLGMQTRFPYPFSPFHEHPRISLTVREPRRPPLWALGWRWRDARRALLEPNESLIDRGDGRFEGAKMFLWRRALMPLVFVSTSDVGAAHRAALPSSKILFWLCSVLFWPKIILKFSVLDLFFFFLKKIRSKLVVLH